MMHAALRTPGSLALTSRVGGVARPTRRRFARVQPRAAANDAPSRVWHCPPPEKERTASQAASVLSKLPPHVLETGGLEPSTQSPQNQQAYLGSLAERFLPVDLSVRGLRVLNVDPPVFAIPDFVSGAEADALAKLAKGGTKLVRNAKTVDLSAKLPAPMGENMPALAQRLGELVEDAKKFVRCDGAWLEGSDLTRWAPVGGFTDPPPPGAFAFEMPALREITHQHSPGASNVSTPVKTGAGPASPEVSTPKSTPGAPSPWSGVAEVTTPGGSKVLAYDALVKMDGTAGIDMARKESYLSEGEFKTVFGMERTAFDALAEWKRKDAKKKVGLF